MSARGGHALGDQRLGNQRPGGQRGWSLFETMVAIGIIATGLMVLVQQMSISFRESHANENRAFAYQKAAALLGEVHNSITLGKLSTSDDLYGLADAAPNPILTTRTDDEGLPFAPDHAMSGNQKRQDAWVWARRITVTPHENSGLYYCKVEVLLRGDDGVLRSEANHAQLFSLLPSTEAPEQVHDVYLLACAETPSLWNDIAELRAHFESGRTTILGQSQAQLRYHWITRLGYGRDPCYMPYVNTARPATSFAPASYWLPGALGDADSGKVLYHSELLQGTHTTELGIVNAQSAVELVPSTIADQFNHCMRTPAAWRLYQQRLAAGLENPEAPPLQLLLDDLQARPERYRNAIFVNLHGRGLPTPPLRNYSDAAKEPAGHAGVRVVTHPARLWTPRDPDGNGDHTDTVAAELRVYGWRTQGSLDVLDVPITVQIFGGDLTDAINAGAPSTLLVDRLAGGIDTTTGVKSSTATYAPFAAAPTSATAPKEMWFEAGYVAGAEPYTWLRLHNTPLVAPVVDTRGLPSNARLYDGDYVPSPVSGSFARDLAWDSAALAMRNTARWRIRIPKTVFGAGVLADADQALRVVTRIGTDVTTGRRWPTPYQPLNASETWTWWTRTASAVPATERAQFLGDPRLCPYEDFAAGGAFAHAYNWHFDNLAAAVDARPLWPCLDGTRLQDGFAGGPRADAPRLLQLVRQSLQAAGAVFVAPGDRLAQTLLLGGEIALPTDTGTSAIAMHTDFGAGALGAVDTIDPAVTGTLVLQRGNPATWWAKPFLGELFPDDMGVMWTKAGNLPLGGATALRWARLQGNALPGQPYGTDLSGPAGGAMGPAGAAMFVATGTGTSKSFVASAPASGTQRIEPGVDAINAATHLVAPAGMAAARTFDWNATNATLPPAFAFVDAYPANTAAEIESSWTTGSVRSGAIATWTGPAGTARLVPWSVGGAPAAAREVALQSLLLGLRALHVGGLPSQPAPIVEVPLLQILEPQNGSSRTDPDLVLIRWQTQWLRFDAQPYAGGYPTPLVRSESDLVYRILWSMDDGAHWVSALTDQPTEANVWPAATSERLSDASAGNESFTFAVPSSLATGQYLLRVEAWRASIQAHYAAHQIRFMIRRSS